MINNIFQVIFNSSIENPGIPRLYTAIAEWLACVIFVVLLPKRLGKISIVLMLVSLVVFILYHYAAEFFPLWLWIVGMLIAIALMYGQMLLGAKISAKEAVFWTSRAFVLAEFMAAVAWQIYYGVICNTGTTNVAVELILLAVIYALITAVSLFIEKRYAVSNTYTSLNFKDLYTSVIIAVVIFGVSNISYIDADTLLSGSMPSELFYIRSLVNLCGIILFYAQQEQRLWYYADRELNSVHTLINRQYEQFKISRENMQQLRYRYHDLKHQIDIIIAEESKSKREEYLRDMRVSLKSYEMQVDTGNPTLNVIVNSKMDICLKNNITITSVADGALLDFMRTMDICTIFGNALDNAVECVSKVDNAEQRIIKLLLAKKNNFISIRIGNYCEGEILFDNGLPLTTKGDSNEHGYGIKSIKQTVDKYHGEISVDYADNWFNLYVLIPINHNAKVI